MHSQTHPCGVEKRTKRTLGAKPRSKRTLGAVLITKRILGAKPRSKRTLGAVLMMAAAGESRDGSGRWCGGYDVGCGASAVVVADECWPEVGDKVMMLVVEMVYRI
ncbi:hypothetical protein Tco_0952724 [Tanacetum coccineum]|uniref:Uncharacterized protein n=1 Tax=Tanacetum coccineum TaxID=301880 RepID=A0ABQ5E3D4_9ASTR